MDRPYPRITWSTEYLIIQPNGRCVMVAQLAANLSNIIVMGGITNIIINRNITNSSLDIR